MATASDPIFSQAGAALLRVYGVSATFTPSVGDPVSCTVFKETFVDNQPVGYESQTPETVTTIEGLVADIGKVPERGETFTIDGADWDVEERMENDLFYYKVAVKV
jgi:hypothetical protein